MSLARRVTLLFGSLLAIVLILGALVVANVLAQREAERKETRLLAASLTASHEFALGQARLTESLAALAQARDPQLRTDVTAQIADQAQRVGDLVTSSAQDTELGALVTPLNDAFARSRSEVVQPILDAVDAGELNRARLLLASDRARASATEVRDAMQQVYAGLAQRRAVVDSRLEDSWRTLFITLLVTTVCLVMAWIAVLRIVHRGVLAPVNDIRSSLRASAANRHLPIPAEGPEELASLAADAEAMRRELVRQADEADAARMALLQDAPLAAEMREAMRPRFPEVGWLRLHGSTRPGEGVIAGDWWDAIARPDGSIAIIIADVSGHGVGAGTAAMQVRAVLDSALADGASPGDALTLVRHALASSPHFVTVVVMVIDDEMLTWANAGHPAPLVVRADTSALRCAQTGPIASRLGGHWDEGRMPFPPGSVIVAFTDGLIEAVDASGAELDEDELVGWVRAAPDGVRMNPQELAERVLANARHRASTLADDVTVLCISRPTR